MKNFFDKIIEKLDNFFQIKNPPCTNCNSTNTKYLWEDHFLDKPNDLYQCKDCNNHFYG